MEILDKYKKLILLLFSEGNREQMHTENKEASASMSLFNTKKELTGKWVNMKLTWTPSYLQLK